MLSKMEQLLPTSLLNNKREMEGEIGERERERKKNCNNKNNNKSFDPSLGLVFEYGRSSIASSDGNNLIPNIGFLNGIDCSYSTYQPEAQVLNSDGLIRFRQPVGWFKPIWKCSSSSSSPPSSPPARTHTQTHTQTYSHRKIQKEIIHTYKYAYKTGWSDKLKPSSCDSNAQCRKEPHTHTQKL